MNREQIYIGCAYGFAVTMFGLCSCIMMARSAFGDGMSGFGYRFVALAVVLGICVIFVVAVFIQTLCSKHGRKGHWN